MDNQQQDEDVEDVLVEDEEDSLSTQCPAAPHHHLEGTEFGSPCNHQHNYSNQNSHHHHHSTHHHHNHHHHGLFPQQQQPGSAADELEEKNLDDASNLLESENGLFQQRMWGCFQSCARAVAQVYMSSKQTTQQSEQDPPAPASSSPLSPHHHHHLNKQFIEESFKSAAQHATSLYKDSIETSRRLIDLGIKTGSNRRTKELLSFVKSRKKRFIKRDELISFLVGKTGAGSGATPSSTVTTTSSRKHGSVHFSGLGSAGASGGGGGGGGGVVGIFDSMYPFGLGLGSQQPVAQHGVHSSQLFEIGGGIHHPERDPADPSQSSSSSSPQFPPTPPFPQIPPPAQQPTDPSFLHLAVQQLFVAGDTSSSQPLESGAATTAGNKRPAQDSNPRSSRRREMKNDDDGRFDDDDSMMEESSCVVVGSSSVDGDDDRDEEDERRVLSFCSKRMRFY